jgi:uncharacterized membrane protein (DUF4010 family)
MEGIFLLLQKFLVAIALGALIGLEREYARFKKRGHDFAGIRTFPLITLFGALSAYMSDLVSPWLLIVSAMLIGILIITAYYSMIRHQPVFGATSEVAGFLAFFIGVLAYFQAYTLAIIITIILTTILFARSVLHNFAEKITQKEMTDTLMFAIIAFLVLPLLPNQNYGPLGMFNPYVVWLMIVLISGIGFVGYALMKWMGEKGITLAGVLGGLVSSTATTTSFSLRSVKDKNIYRALALGVILANGVMFVRVMLEVFFVNRALFAHVVLPLSLLALITLIFSYFLWRKAKNTKGKMHLTSPLSLKPALKFGAIFALSLAIVKVANFYLSSKGVYIVSFISGLADVDAIALSLSQLARGDLLATTARNGILIATLTNVAAKGAIAYWFGGKDFRKIVVWFFLALIVMGVGMMFVL